MIVGPKEHAYDKEIHPLMKQIITICQREKIAMVAHFDLEGTLSCTTVLALPEFKPSVATRTAVEVIRRSGDLESAARQQCGERN